MSVPYNVCTLHGLNQTQLFVRPWTVLICDTVSSFTYRFISLSFRNIMSFLRYNKLNSKELQIGCK